MTRSVRWGIPVLALAIVVAGCSESDSARVMTSDSVPGVEVLVPNGAIEGDLRIEASIGATGPGLSGTVDLGAAFALSPGTGAQPTQPIEVRFDAALVDPDDPNLVFLARWDEVDSTWVPLPTDYDADSNEYVAEIDHFSWYKFWEWGIWEDIGNGIRWLADRIAAAFDWVTSTLKSSLDRVAEFLSDTAGVVVDWLGLAGAELPTCDGPHPTEVELRLSDPTEKGIIKACVEEGADGHVIVRAANNRPYGLVLERPSYVSVRLHQWPDLGLSGEAAVYSFYEALPFLGESYVPPSATVIIDVDMTGRDQVVLEATSTPAFVGVDMAAAWLYVFADTAGQVDTFADAAGCLLGTGRSLMDVVDDGSSANPLQFLEGVKSCLTSLGYEFGKNVLGDLFDVTKATIKAVPALVSNLRDTDYSEFQVAESIALVRTGATDPLAGGSADTSTILTLDVSGSMGDASPVGPAQPKLDAAKRAANDLLEVIEIDVETGTAHEVGLVTFQTNAATAIAATADLARVSSTIGRMVADGGTNIGDALDQALLSVDTTVAARHIVLLSDGDVTEGISQDEILESVVPRAQRAGVKIDVVAFAAPGSLDEGFLRQLATSTGGSLDIAATAFDLRQAFIESRHATTGSVVVSTGGTLSPGETLQLSELPVAEGAGEIVASLVAEEGSYQVHMVDPFGRVVSGGGDGVRSVTGNPATTAVQDPLPGTWLIYGTPTGRSLDRERIEVPEWEPPGSPELIGAAGSGIWWMGEGVFAAGTTPEVRAQAGPVRYAIVASTRSATLRAAAFGDGTRGSAVAAVVIISLLAGALAMGLPALRRRQGGRKRVIVALGLVVAVVVAAGGALLLGVGGDTAALTEEIAVTAGTPHSDRAGGGGS